MQPETRPKSSRVNLNKGFEHKSPSNVTSNKQQAATVTSKKSPIPAAANATPSAAKSRNKSRELRWNATQSYTTIPDNKVNQHNQSSGSRKRNGSKGSHHQHAGSGQKKFETLDMIDRIVNESYSKL